MIDHWYFFLFTNLLYFSYPIAYQFSSLYLVQPAYYNARKINFSQLNIKARLTLMTKPLVDSRPGSSCRNLFDITGYIVHDTKEKTVDRLWLWSGRIEIPSSSTPRINFNDTKNGALDTNMLPQMILLASLLSRSSSHRFPSLRWKFMTVHFVYVELQPPSSATLHNLWRSFKALGPLIIVKRSEIYFNHLKNGFLAFRDANY